MHTTPDSTTTGRVSPWARLGLFVVVILLAVASYFRFVDPVTPAHYLFTTRSSHGAENTAPWIACMITVMATAYMAFIILFIVARVKVPKQSDDPLYGCWVRQQRNQVYSNGVLYVMLAMMATGVLATAITYNIA